MAINRDKLLAISELNLAGRIEQMEERIFCDGDESRSDGLHNQAHQQGCSCNENTKIYIRGD